MSLPKIISVDDHVVEPPHVWQTWLPEKYRELGPRVERHQWADFVHKPGARYGMQEDPNGLWGDAWYYEDEIDLCTQAICRDPARLYLRARRCN